MKFDIILEKQSVHRINGEINRRKLKQIASVGCRNQQYGFSSKLVDFGEPEHIFDECGQERYRYFAKIRLSEGQARSEDVAVKRYKKILENIARAALSHGWQIVGEKVRTATVTQGNRLGLFQDHLAKGSSHQDEAPEPESIPPFRVPRLTPEIMEKAFQGLWERESHIRVIQASVERFVDSCKTQPSHVLLYGHPAAAKTTLFKKFKEFYEYDGHERVAHIDAPTMTKAGFETWLLSRAKNNNLPEIVLVEEIEKVQPENLLCLLSVMASGYIQRTNARIGKVDGQMPILVWATCNDEELLKKFARGALWSRFTHKLPCARPSRELMWKILLREVEKIPGGKPEWAEKALFFGWDNLGMRDPRAICGLLDGRDRLITGEYQEDMRAILKAFEKEKDE